MNDDLGVGFPAPPLDDAPERDQLIELAARRIAAHKMGLVKDPYGLRLPDDLWRQAIAEAEASLRPSYDDLVELLVNTKAQVFYLEGYGTDGRGWEGADEEWKNHYRALARKELKWLNA